MGTLDKDTSYTRAFITGPNGVGMSILGMPNGGTGGEARGINDAEQVVGHYLTTESQSYGEGLVNVTFSSITHGYITGPNGVGITDLGTLGGYGSYAYAVNNAGRVVGSSYTIAADNEHAFITGPNGRAGFFEIRTNQGFRLARNVRNAQNKRSRSSEK